MEKRSEARECCLCQKSYTGYGNNAAPILEGGRCCDECNNDRVVPARLAAMAHEMPASGPPEWVTSALSGGVAATHPSEKEKEKKQDGTRFLLIAVAREEDGEYEVFDELVLPLYKGTSVEIAERYADLICYGKSDLEAGRRSRSPERGVE